MTLAIAISSSIILSSESDSENLAVDKSVLTQGLKSVYLFRLASWPDLASNIRLSVFSISFLIIWTSLNIWGNPVISSCNFVHNIVVLELILYFISRSSADSMLIWSSDIVVFKIENKSFKSFIISFFFVEDVKGLFNVI